MWDHVRGLEEEECWIGIQKQGRMYMTDLFTPQPEYEVFSLQGRPNFPVPIMECLHGARSGVSRSRPSDGRPGGWMYIEECSKMLR